MRKILKKVALALVFSLAVAGVAPAAKTTMAASTAKTFTYAEQTTGKKVTELQMKVGDKEDLKFIGVPDYTKYNWGWVSSNESVAVVDRAGVITARGEGVTCIRLVIGDESVYTSEGVIVYVGSKDEIRLGTSADKTFTSQVMNVRGTLDLNYYGFTGDASKYLCKWTSTDPSVASVTKDGVVLATKNGLTVIQLELINLYKDEVLYAVPVAIQVGGSAVAPTSAPTVPTATPKPVATTTPTPTPYPWLPTATPAPTVLPTETPAPTVIPASYRVTVEADNCLLVSFSKAVEYDRSDVELHKVITIGSYSVEDAMDISKAELNEAGTELRIYANDVFENGVYNIRIGGETIGTKVTVNVGEVNKIVVSYECLGKPNVAYACEVEEDYIDIPVNLSYQLYYNNINVTETYANNGYIEYEIISASDEDEIDVDGDSIYFYKANERVVLRAVYNYENSAGKEKELASSAIAIVAKDLGDYTIEFPQKEWTIVKEDSTAKIDWENPVHSVVAGEDGYKLVALIADNYGNLYATDDLGTDIAAGIYSIDDDSQLFAKKGYSVNFKAVSDDFVILEDGGLFTYQQVKRAVVALELAYTDDYGNDKTRNIGVWNIDILAERKLNKITASETAVTLATKALEGFEERFCEAEIDISLFDQYGEAWKGEYDLELSSTNSDVDDALGGSDVAYLDGTTLHINARDISAVAPRASSVAFVVKEANSGASVKINVSLKTPTTASGEIVATNWSVEAKDVNITFKEDSKYNTTQEAVIEILQTSKNNVNVGLASENVYLLDTKSPKFDIKDDYTIGDYYVLITGPDGKVVERSANGSGLGVWIDEKEHCIKINLTAPESGMMLEFLESGKYSVKVYKITNITTTRVVTDTESATFTVKDDTKDIAYKTKRNSKTSLTVDGSDDLDSVKEIVAELMIFTINGSTWSDMTAEMITDVDYKIIGEDYVFIRSVEFAVPVDGKDANALTYRREVKGINQSIRTGVDED